MYANIELGWSPLLAVASDGTREVLQVIGYTGGMGTAPTTGLYVGSNSYVTNITDGVNIKGNAGAGIAFQAGTDILSAGTVLFSNSPTVTFGLAGSILTASAAGGSGGGNVSIQGSTGNISFGNANGMTFGGNASTITASYTVPSVSQFQLSADMSNYQTTGNYLTTAMLSNAGSNFVGLNSALTANGVSATINSSGVSLNFPAFLTTAQPVGAYLTTAMQSNAGSDFVNTSQSSLFQATSLMSNYQSANAGYLTSQSNQAFSASGSSSTFQTLQFGNSNGVSFSISNGSLVGSVATNYQSQGAYLTTAMQSNAATISNIKLSAGTLSSNRSDMTFSNANGVSFGLETNGVITASVAAAGGAQTGISGLSAGTTQMTSGTASFANGGGVSFGINGNTLTATVRTDYQSSGNYLTTAMASNASTNFAGIGSAITNGTMTFGTGGLSLNLSNHLTTARASTDAIGLNTALTANGVTWTVNSSGLSLNIPAFLTTAMQSASSSNFAGVGSAITNGTMTFGTGGLSLNLSNHLTTAMASNAGSNFVGLNSALTANGVSASINSSGISLNFPAFLTTAMASNQSTNFAGLGFTSASTAGTNIAATLGTNGLSMGIPNYVTAAAGGGITNINVSAGTTSQNLSNFVFANSNNVSFGLSGSTITASINAGAGGGIALANSETTYSSGTANLVVAGGAMTIQSAVGQSFQFSVPSQSSLSGTGQVSISVNGSTISIGVPNAQTFANWEVIPPGNNTTFSSMGQGSLYLQKMIPIANYSFGAFELRASGSFVSSTNSQVVAYTVDYGLYSLNADTYSNIATSRMVINASYNSSTAYGITMSQGTGSYTISSNNTVLASYMTGLKHLYLPFASTITGGGQYAFGILIRSATTGGTSPYRLALLNQTYINNLTIGKMYASTILASNSTFVGDFQMGVGNATTAAMPTSIAKSIMTNQISQGRLYLQLD